MVDSNRNTVAFLLAGSSFDKATPNPVDLYCEKVERFHVGCPYTIYYLRPGLPRPLQQRVREHVATAHSGTRVNQIGLEIFAASIVGNDIGTL